MRISFINLADWPIPNMALAYLSASVERTSHKPLIIDSFPQRPRKYILNKIKEHSPDIIGFSVLTYNLKASVELAKKIKIIYPHIKIIFGGIHPTLLPEETLKISWIDAVCIGEGERSLVELLDHLEAEKEPKVKGIWYKKGNEIIRNELREWEKDLDSLPFPNWDHWDMELYLKTFPKVSGGLYILASRGCPFECSFCSQKSIKESMPDYVSSYHRVRSANNIIQEIKINIEKYKRLGLRAFLFADDTFGINRKQFNEFTEYYVKENFHKKYLWGCQTRADIIDEEWVSRAKKSGCFLIEFGLENSNEMIRIKKYNKKITDEQFRDALGWLKKYKMIYNINILVGSFGENPNDIWKNVLESYALSPLFLYISAYLPLPKVQLRIEHGDDIIKETNLLGGLPRIQTSILSIRKLNYIFWQIRLLQIIKKIKIGFKLRKATFILDILKHISNYKGQRQINLLHPLILIQMLDKRILDYYIEENVLNKSKN